MDEIEEEKRVLQSREDVARVDMEQLRADNMRLRILEGEVTLLP